MKFAFTVPGEPQPWMRAGRTAEGRHFTPKAMASFQQKVQLYAKASAIPLLEGPVELVVVVYLAKEPWAWGSGDADNYLKNVADSLNGVAFNDDCRVVVGCCIKRQDAEHQRTEVMLRGKPAEVQPPIEPQRKPHREPKKATGIPVPAVYR